MKKLKFFAPILIILMMLTACQQENIFEDQIDLIPGESEVELRSQNPVPFHASFTSTVVSILPNPEECGEDSPALHLVQSVSGNATHMGNISGSVTSCVIPLVIIFNGKVTLIAANGDELFFEQTGPGALEIIGGTGRFDEASGSVTTSFEVIVPGSVFSSQFDGEIQY